MMSAGTFCTKQTGNPRAMCQNQMYLFSLRHLDQDFSDFSVCRNHLEKLLKQTQGLFCKNSDSVSLQWALRIWIVNWHPGDTDASGQWVTFRSYKNSDGF